MNKTYLKDRNFIGIDGPCLELSGVWGSATVALLGGQLLSWIPSGGTEVFWVTATPAALPAPLRGGVPICWPWFARQGVSANHPQHGVVRTLNWTVTSQNIQTDHAHITLAPDWAQCTEQAKAWLEQYLGPDFETIGLLQSITFEDKQLTQELTTVNDSDHVLRLTQALHSYFRVGDVRNIQIEGLDNCDYLDKLQDFSRFRQPEPYAFGETCDRIYLNTQGQFTLTDPQLKRKIILQTERLEPLVVWNPGRVEGSKMADVGEAQWTQFFCLEASHAEPQGKTLLPNSIRNLRHCVRIENLD
jgi:glucose-6-phosphate 1-epimerase